MASVAEQVSEARAAGREVRLDLDTTSLLVSSAHLTLNEIGASWLALLKGDESEFSDSVVRVRSRAPGRRNIPHWQTTRQRIFERDGWRCTYCGSTDELECDHIHPVARGGSHSDDNLTTACRTCNRAKRDLTLAEWLQ